MAKNTAVIGLYEKEVADGDDTFNIETMLNGNWEKIDNAFGDMDTQTAGGAATAMEITLESVITYRAGMKVTVIASLNNGSAATTLKINSLAAKPVYKPNTTAAPKITAGKAYNFILSGDLSYFFLDASAEGDAVAANVLAGKTFSNDDDTGISGTMINRGAVAITPGTANQAILEGYHNGTGSVAGDADLISTNIKSGINIFGVAGNSNVVDTSAGDATDAQILSGKKAYVDGALVTGTMTSKVGSNTVLTPGATDQAIPAGYYGGALTDGKVASISYTAGENLYVSADGVEALTGGTAYTLYKEFQVTGSGIIRVKYDASVYSAGKPVYTNIFKNGVAVGTERYITLATFTTYTEDIAVANGDLIQIKGRATVTDFNAKIQNARIYTGIVFPKILVTNA